jgi:hypothetical protein
MTKPGSTLPHRFLGINQLYTCVSLLSTGISGLHPFAHSAEFSFLRVGIGYSLLSTTLIVLLKHSPSNPTLPLLVWHFIVSNGGVSSISQDIRCRGHLNFFACGPDCFCVDSQCEDFLCLQPTWQGCHLSLSSL